MKINKKKLLQENKFQNLKNFLRDESKLGRPLSESELLEEIVRNQEKVIEILSDNIVEIEDN